METETRGGWRKRYDRSVREEKRRLADAEEQESEWVKLLSKATYTGTFLDLLILPFVLVFSGLPALARKLRSR